MNEMVTTGIAALIVDATSMITDNFLPILTVLGSFAGANIGFKLFKRFTGKIG